MLSTGGAIKQADKASIAEVPRGRFAEGWCRRRPRPRRWRPRCRGLAAFRPCWPEVNGDRVHRLPALDGAETHRVVAGLDVVEKALTAGAVGTDAV